MVSSFRSSAGTSCSPRVLRTGWSQYLALSLAESNRWAGSSGQRQSVFKENLVALQSAAEKCDQKELESGKTKNPREPFPAKKSTAEQGSDLALIWPRAHGLCGMVFKRFTTECRVRTDSGWSWILRRSFAWPCVKVGLTTDVNDSRTCHFYRCLFDRLPVRISTSDLHHRTLREKKSTRSGLRILEASFPQKINGRVDGKHWRRPDQ